MSTYGFRDDHKSKFQKSYFYLCSPTLWICSRPLTWTILNAQTGSDPYNIHWVFSLPFSSKGIMKPKERVSLLGKETPILNSTWSPIYWLYNCACSVARSYPTFCDPMDCSPLCSSIHGTSQARKWELVAISFSKESSWSRDWTHSLLHWQARLWVTRKLTL